MDEVGKSRRSQRLQKVPNNWGCQGCNRFAAIARLQTGVNALLGGLDTPNCSEQRLAVAIDGTTRSTQVVLIGEICKSAKCYASEP